MRTHRGAILIFPSNGISCQDKKSSTLLQQFLRLNFRAVFVAEELCTRLRRGRSKMRWVSYSLSTPLQSFSVWTRPLLLDRRDWMIVAGLPQAVLLLQEMWSVNGLSGSCSWTRLNTHLHFLFSICKLSQVHGDFSYIQDSYPSKTPWTDQDIYCNVCLKIVSAPERPQVAHFPVWLLCFASNV